MKNIKKLLKKKGMHGKFVYWVKIDTEKVILNQENGFHGLARVVH